MKNSTINWDSTSKAYVVSRLDKAQLSTFRFTHKIETPYNTFYLYRGSCHPYYKAWQITTKYGDVEWYFRKHWSIKKLERIIADWEFSQFCCVSSPSSSIVAMEDE